ncbi:hypothetical protein [Paraburkholderia ultramafica]|uniref:hypothetical protein n=1 Tax=Paraburkholderia ultramafica TaxID=1544867 RepID=UPI00158156C9|nr:hypothetical protein [Paraburkholderia ultramafica]
MDVDFGQQGLSLHDLPLVYCKPHAMQSLRRELRVLRAAARLPGGPVTRAAVQNWCRIA